LEDCKPAHSSDDVAFTEFTNFISNALSLQPQTE